MKSVYTFIIFYLFLQELRCEERAVSPTEGSNSQEDLGNFDERDPHCFRFTWLAGKKKDSPFNSTCKDLLKDNKQNDIPCRQPIVISDNGTAPDMDYLYKNYRDRVLCRLTEGQSCVKYSYFFNNKVENVTYMCAKVVSVGEGAITSGCWSEVDSGYETQVCMCQSAAGNIKPCNNGFKSYYNTYMITMLLIVLFYMYK